MEIGVGIFDKHEANEFLRSLWAEVASEFGGCSWNYMPHKDTTTKRIYFGIMSAGAILLEVSVSYKEKGTISNIYFDYPSSQSTLDIKSSLGKQLKGVVRKARRKIGNYKEFRVTKQVKSYYPLSSYCGDQFEISKLSGEITEISFPVWAYDMNQCIGLGVQKINQIMDFLAAETNVPFWINQERIDTKAKSLLQTSYQEEDYMNGYSVQDECLIISKEGESALDYIVNNNGQNEVLNKFLDACYHFHTARKYDAQLNEYKGFKEKLSEDGNRLEIEVFIKNKDLESAYKMGKSQTEIASTLYMSALEVITLIDFNEVTCDSCGQPKFSIMKRVRELASKYLTPVSAGSINEYYNKRSAYLHKGSILTNPTPSFSSVPLLDENEKTGTNFPIKINVDYLREDTSYILRQFYKQNFSRIFQKE
jgi:hypothetical protein